MATPGGRRSPPAILLLVGVAAACGRSDRAEGGRQELGASTVTVRDAEDRTIAFTSPPERIVSLVPSASQTMIALGASERLVGRTEYDTLGILAQLPSVGGGLHPTLEVLIALEPDLVIRFAGQTDLETPARLDDLGVAHFSVAPESVSDIRRMIIDLGRIVEHDAEATALIERTDSVLADIRHRVAALEPIRVAWVVGGDPPWVSGPGTYIDDLVAVAGGENVFADLGRLWAAVSLETLIARRPDLVLTIEGNELDPRLARLMPVRTVSPVVSLPGPDLARAAREIAEGLHPTLRRRP